MKTSKPLLLQRTAKTFIDLYQSVRKAAAKLDMEHTALHRMSKGQILDANDDNLAKLGLERIDGVEIHRRRK